MKYSSHPRAWLCGLVVLSGAGLAAWTFIHDSTESDSPASVTEAGTGTEMHAAPSSERPVRGKSAVSEDWRSGPLWPSDGVRPLAQQVVSAAPITGGDGVAKWVSGQRVSLALGKGIAAVEGEVTMNVVREDGGRAVRLNLGADAESGESTGELFGNLDRDGGFQGFIRYRDEAGVYRLTVPAGEEALTVQRIPLDDLVCSYGGERPDGMLTPAEAAVPAALIPPTAITTPEVVIGTNVLSVGDVRMAEGQTKGNVMQFPVVCGVASGSGKAAITVQWTLVGVTATAGSDFKKASGKLTLGNGKTQGIISVTTVPDRVSEGDETFKVVLSNPMNATLGKSEGIGTILDDEWTSTVALTSPVRLQEPTGDVAKQKASYSVSFTVTPPVQEAVSLPWRLYGSTAVSGKDFTAASGTVKLAPGQGTFTVPVSILGDATIEGEEVFSIQFSSVPVMLTAPAAQVTITAPEPASTGTPSPVPAFQSKPGAAKVLYLELNGATLTGTAWNKTSAPIVTPSVYPKFGDDGCKTIWVVVAEAYRAFDVNVTTDKAVFDATPVANRSWCLFTSEPSKFGSSAAGIGYVGVFGQPAYQPALAFTNVDYTIDAYPTIATHELGHNLGLSHDGKGTSEYFSGQQGARFSWGPWMGSPYYMFYRQFSIGDYAGATQHQDDLALIARYLPVKADEAGDSLTTAVDLPLQASGSAPAITANITSRTDVDSYRLVIGESQTVTVSLNADQDGSYSLAPGMKIYNSSGAEAVPAGAGWTDDGGVVTWTGTLAPGIYRVDVDGIGDPSPNGFSDYGSIGGYTIQATAP